MNELILKEAAWVVIMYDQANTNNKLSNLDSRSKLLASSIEDLRKAIGQDKIDELTRSGTWVERS